MSCLKLQKQNKLTRALFNLSSRKLGLVVVALYLETRLLNLSRLVCLEVVTKMLRNCLPTKAAILMLLAKGSLSRPHSSIRLTRTKRQSLHSLERFQRLMSKIQVKSLSSAEFHRVVTSQNLLCSVRILLQTRNLIYSVERQSSNQCLILCSEEVPHL